MQWRSIESAPKDGRPVWARGNDYGKKGGSRHSTWAFWDGECWTESGSDKITLSYLTEWLDMETDKTETEAALKLFVWEDFAPDHTNGLAFAIAKDETQARNLIVEHKGYSPFDWGNLTIYPLNQAIARSVSGGG